VKSINIEKGKNSDVSPLSSNSMASLLASNGSQKPKSQWMTVAQKQEQWASDCAEWNNYKD
jgi:hypothetical protein